MNSGNRNNFEDDFDTNRFSNSNNSSGGRGTRNGGNSRTYNESTPYSDSNTAYSNSNSNNNNNNFQHKKGDSGSEVTSPTYRTNTYSSSSPTSRQKTFNDSEDFAYSTSTLNNLYQPEHAANTGASPLSKSKRVDPNDYYELSAYNNRGPTVENTNEDDYNPNVYNSERIYLPPHVKVSASAGTAQEIPYYPQRESHLYDEYLNANNQNSYNNTNSYNSHYEEDLMHPNSRTYLDPNATNYARPMNPYVTPAAPIYNPQTLVSQVPSNNKKNWWKYPYFTFFITLVQVGVFAYQLYSNYYYTSNPIATHPINFMIGPSRSNLIHQGARFVPCMRPGFSDSPVECLQNNNGLGQPLCPLPEVCGFENFSNGQPNQWFRFITPIFLHAGVLHILFNLFSQLTLGGHLEKYWGPFRIFFIYFASGIGGFLFGGVYAMPDLPSVGASGAIFGLVGCELVDLIQNWKYIGSPGCQLFKLVITIAINFALGLLPFIDNFSHIGGFIVGVLCSILIIPLPSRMPKKVILVKWTFMAVAFGILVYLFYFGATGFYDDKTRNSCTWCKYLNCLPVFPICKNPTSPGNGF